jgi:hypothetical protein
MNEERVEFENERVRVLRVLVDAGASHRPPSRKDRVLVWLAGAEHVRTEPNGEPEELHRWPGDVAWRSASEHQIDNRGNAHELIIVELK